jgi:3-oxoacyl-[acyl-carrier protein] reductase
VKLGIEGKVAIVLAASKGMGRASAKALIDEGCRVAICARTKSDVERTGGEIGAEMAEAVDVEKRDEMARFVAAVRQRFGGIDILVTNCGGPPPGKPLEFDDAAWDTAVKSTLMVAVNWVRAVAPVMIAQKWGRIINIVSIAAKQPIDTLILSNTMRAGVVGFAKTMARELGPHGITVNSLCPGLILTDRLKRLGEEHIKRMSAEIPVGRVGTPEEFAAAVAFLAGEPARYITGATIQVDGGLCRGLM